jgi:hypothetical protein
MIADELFDILIVGDINMVETVNLSLKIPKDLKQRLQLFILKSGKNVKTDQSTVIADAIKEYVNEQNM